MSLPILSIGTLLRDLISTQRLIAAQNFALFRIFQRFRAADLFARCENHDVGFNQENMMKRPVEDGLSLLVGAGVGMALMYLLDPDTGSGRRENLQQAARERLAKAGNAASAGLEHLHDAVDRAAQTPAVQLLAARAADAAKGLYNEIGSHATAAAEDAHRQATDAAEGFQSKINGKLDDLRGKASDLRDRANDLKETARSRYGKWLNRSSLALGRDEDHHYIGQTACALGSLAIGAGAVYLLDPEMGATRRAQLVDRTTYAVRETGDFFRKTGRRLVTRGRYVARAAADQAKDRAMDTVAYFRPTEGAGTLQQPENESTQASMGT
jgi:hypothetical protein